jgi:signal transduction histidine kinase
VREQAQRLARLVGDLLFLARLDTQSADIPMQPLDLQGLMPAIVAQLEPLAAERQQTITLAPVPAVSLIGNKDLLMRLLMNLVDNALRYTPSGGQITASCTQEGANVVIRICDTGPGIAPEHIPQLFERFYRADRGRNRAYGGSGLGLPIAQSIAHQHGGRIVVESVVGQGSTFSVIVPTPSQARAHMRLQTAAIAKMG